MLVKISTQIVLAVGLLPLATSVMAAPSSTLSDGNSGSQLAWLLGAAIVGFSVVARRNSSSPTNTDTTPKTNSLAGKPANWPAPAIQE
jgi:hypothetical protein